jgi:hypothetical protein
MSRIRLSLISVALLALWTAGSVGAQPVDAEPCAAAMRAAFTSAVEICAGTALGQACYGSGDLYAEPFDPMDSLDFILPGDSLALAGVQSLTSYAANGGGALGVIVLNLPFSLPEDPERGVTVLAFGEIEIKNLIDPAVLADPDILPDIPTVMTATAAADVDVYMFPFAMGFADDTLPAGATFTASGRTDDNQWLRIMLDGNVAWVQTRDVMLEGSLGDLSVVDPMSFEMPMTGEPAILPEITPLQALNFRSDTARCGDVPAAGLLVQTPPDAGRVWMRVNGVDVTARDATFLMQTNMSLQVLAGSVQVAADGAAQMVPAGQQTSIPQGADGRPSGPPSAPTGATTTSQSFSLMDIPLAPLVDPLPELELVPLVDPDDTGDDLDLGLAPIVIENTRWISQGEVVVDNFKLGWTVPFMVDDELRIISADGAAYITYAGNCVQLFDTWTMRVGGRVVDGRFALLYLDQGGSSSDNIRELPCGLPALFAELEMVIQSLFRGVDLLAQSIERFSELHIPVRDGASSRIEVGGAYALYEVYFDHAPAGSREYDTGAPLSPEILQMLEQENRNNVLQQLISRVLEATGGM